MTTMLLEYPLIFFSPQISIFLMQITDEIEHTWKFFLSLLGNYSNGTIIKTMKIRNMNTYITYMINIKCLETAGNTSLSTLFL